LLTFQKLGFLPMTIKDPAAIGSKKRAALEPPFLFVCNSGLPDDFV
jgi:hypothetical protein